MRNRISTVLAILCASFAIVEAGGGDRDGREVSRYEEVRVQGMLDRLLGPGRATAVVTVRVDRSKVEEVSTAYGPTATISRSASDWRGVGGSGSAETIVRRVSRRVTRRVTTGPRLRQSVMILMQAGELSGLRTQTTQR